MNKIPVFKTIAYAYTFTFGHLATIIGLIWIPMLIFSLGSFFVMRPYYEAMASAAANGTPISGGPMIVYVFAFEAVAFLILAVVGVAITREALGLRKPGPVFAHVSLGMGEFRVFGAFLILVGLWLGFILAYVLAVAVVGGVVGAVLKAAGGSPLGGALAAGVILVAGLFALFYAMVRLSYLVVPATVAEGTIGIIRSWALTRGNFWRIFAICLATLLPITLVMGAVQVAILGPDAFFPPLDALKDPAKEAQFLAHQMRTVTEHMPLLAGLGFLMSPILYGLIFAPNAIAYRSLVPPGTEPVAETH